MTEKTRRGRKRKHVDQQSSRPLVSVSMPTISPVRVRKDWVRLHLPFLSCLTVRPFWGSQGEWLHPVPQLSFPFWPPIFRPSSSAWWLLLLHQQVPGSSPRQATMTFRPQLWATEALNMTSPCWQRPLPYVPCSPSLQVWASQVCLAAFFNTCSNSSPGGRQFYCSPHLNVEDVAMRDTTMKSAKYLA